MTNVYRIGVQIAMASNGAQLLGVLARHLGGVHTQTKQLTGQFNALKLAIGGAVAVGGGLALVGMFKAPLEEARKFEMAVGRFSRFGLGPERTREAAEFAKQMKITGSTYTENMTRMAEAQGVFRESGLTGEAALRGAKIAAPILAKIDFANAALDDETRAKMHTSSLAMLRFIEMRGGVNSPEKFAEIANAGFKAITSSGGSVNWEQLRQFMARGGVAARGLNNDALFGKMEPIITEMKGSTAGTALMTAYGRLSGAQRLPNQIAHALVDMGVWDGSKIQWNSQGGIKRIMGGVGGLPGNPMKDLAGFSSDPFGWYDANVRGIYEKQHLSMAERARSNFAIFGRTGGALFSLYENQHEPVQKSVDAQRKAMGIDAAYGVAGGTLNGKIIDMHAKFTNLMERLGEAVLPMAVKGLEVLVPALAKLTDWVVKHPAAVSAIAKTLVSVGAALVGFGTVAIAIAAGAAVMAAGTVGIVVAGVTATVAAVTTLLVLNWGSITKAAQGLAHFVADIYRIGAFILAHPLRAGFDAASGGNAALAADATGRKAPARRGGPNILGVLDPFAPLALAGAVFGGRGHVPPPTARGAGGGGHGTVYMDGKKVGKIISGYQAYGLGGNNVPFGRYDPAAALPAPGAGYVR